jgi:hypothetical protein
MVHLGGEPIRFDEKGILQVKSEPKEVRLKSCLILKIPNTKHLASFFLVENI